MIRFIATFNKEKDGVDIDVTEVNTSIAEIAAVAMAARDILKERLAKEEEDQDGKRN